MRRAWRSLGAVVATAVVAAAAGGCGGASDNGESAKPAPTVLADAKAASAAAGSVHLSGSLHQGGHSLALDEVAGSGGGGGTVTEGGATLRVVVRGSTIYLFGDEASWAALTSPAVAKVVAGRWLRTTTANQSFASLAELFSVSALVRSFTPSGQLARGATTTFAGQRAVPLLDRGSDGGTMYVAATGKPYILGLSGAGAQGHITFDRYGASSLPAPPATSTDLSSLAG